MHEDLSSYATVLYISLLTNRNQVLLVLTGTCNSVQAPLCSTQHQQTMLWAAVVKYVQGETVNMQTSLISVAGKQTTGMCQV